MRAADRRGEEGEHAHAAYTRISPCAATFDKVGDDLLTPRPAKVIVKKRVTFGDAVKRVYRLRTDDDGVQEDLAKAAHWQDICKSRAQEFSTGTVPPDLPRVDENAVGIDVPESLLSAMKRVAKRHERNCARSQDKMEKPLVQRAKSGTKGCVDKLQWAYDASVL